MILLLMKFPILLPELPFPPLSLALYICGFGCGGVLATVCCCNCSIAAAVMSAIHPVAGGSAYACEFCSNLRTQYLLTLVCPKGSLL